ncbi:MAG: LysR family transcriptional regulator [Ilumatobacter sp.]
MDIREARTFAAVCDTLSFGGAARSLVVSASTVSETISKLEERLGVRLIDRTAGSVSMTRSAHRLLPLVRDLLEAEAELERAAAAERSGGARLVIGTLYGLGAEEVRAAAEQIGLVADFRTFEVRQPACGLAKGGAVDAAVVVGPLSIDAELIRMPLWREGRLVPVPPGHRLTSLEQITVADVDEVGWVPVEVDDVVWQRHWRLDDLRGGPPVEAGQAESTGIGMVDAVVSGRGAMITIESFRRLFAATPLDLYPVVDAPELTVDLAWRRDVPPGRQAELAEIIAATGRHDLSADPPANGDG